MPSTLELFKSLHSTISISFFTSALFTQLALGKPIVVERQGPAAVVEVPIIAGWLAVTSILATDVAPVGIEAGAFSGAVVHDMFGNLDQDKPWDIGSGNCVMSISTWGGGHCSVDTTPGPKANAGSQTTHHDDGKDWNGICNPVVKFYRPDYYLTEYMYNGTWNGDWTGDGKYPQCSRAARYPYGVVSHSFHLLLEQSTSINMLTSYILGSLSSLSLSWICAWIGVFYLIRKTGDIYLFLVDLFVLSGTDLRKYGEKGSWAIINGVEDDLGAEYALALASHGFNTLLLSHTQSKLEALAQEIKSHYSDVQTKILLTDPSNTSSDNYNELEAFIKHLNVAILVNNDSRLHTIPVPFVITHKEEITDIISVNCTATLMVTRLIAHGMAQRHRGLILTMGSFNGLFATPLLATYSGSKAFLQQWSTALAAELKSEGVDVQLVLSSTISKAGEGNWLIPTPKDFVKTVLGKVGKTGAAHCIGWSMTPYWAHAFAQLTLQNFPSLTGEILPMIQKYMQERIRLRALDTMGHVVRRHVTYAKEDKRRVLRQRSFFFLSQINVHLNSLHFGLLECQNSRMHAFIYVTTESEFNFHSAGQSKTVVTFNEDEMTFSGVIVGYVNLLGPRTDMRGRSDPKNGGLALRDCGKLLPEQKQHPRQRMKHLFGRCQLSQKYARITTAGSLPQSQRLTRSDFIQKHVVPLLHQKRGLELPGESNPKLIYDLFNLFSTNWEGFSKRYIDKICDICDDFVKRVIDERWPEGRRQQIKSVIIDDQINARKADALGELEKLSTDHSRYLRPYDPEYLRRTRSTATEGLYNNTNGVVSHETDPVEQMPCEEYPQKMHVLYAQYDSSGRRAPFGVSSDWDINGSCIWNLDVEMVRRITEEDKLTTMKRAELKDKRRLDVSVRRATDLCVRKDLKKFIELNSFHLPDKGGLSPKTAITEEASVPKSRSTQLQTSRQNRHQATFREVILFPFPLGGNIHHRSQQESRFLSRFRNIVTSLGKNDIRTGSTANTRSSTVQSI
ncbi:hypothetical protein G7Y89_g14360 [Cudoniella acicularis]|uniref:Very-long-chain 3-oxoacyl-CoA reductase n=1 Tax=Cudoniella acicularis TaxID=354080 RepID=A0A8H4R3N2_9HELO|nr:hypothetical protein G7Y89_g14360 [Cudoniella acicularis]